MNITLILECIDMSWKEEKDIKGLWPKGWHQPMTCCGMWCNCVDLAWHLVSASVILVYPPCLARHCWKPRRANGSCKYATHWSNWWNASQLTCASLCNLTLRQHTSIGCFRSLAPASRKTWCTYQWSNSLAVGPSLSLTPRWFHWPVCNCLQQGVNKTNENDEVANNMHAVVAVSSHELPPPVYISTPKSKVCWCPMSMPDMLSAPSLSVRNNAWYRFSKTSGLQCLFLILRTFQNSGSVVLYGTNLLPMWCKRSLPDISWET